MVVMALALLVLGVGGVVVLASPDAASVAQAERMDSYCPAFDLTGRAVVNVIFDAGETRCVYKRPKEADECPTHTPVGWTVVGKIDAPKNKDKVVCVYHDLSATD